MNRTMKQISISIVNKLILSIFVISITLFAGCSDDPESTNEEEVITTITVTLKSKEVDGHEVTLSWDDLNLDAVVDENEIVVSGNLLADTTYQASVQILNRSTNPEVDITEEIKEEAEEHILCYIVTGAGISITTTDEDKYGMPLGLTSTWATTSAVSEGTVNVALRHQPGVKTGDCPGFGETDATITFPVNVTFAVE